jgi:hypothetical protein
MTGIPSYSSSVEEEEAEEARSSEERNSEDTCTQFSSTRSACMLRNCTFWLLVSGFQQMNVRVEEGGADTSVHLTAGRRRQLRGANENLGARAWMLRRRIRGRGGGVLTATSSRRD